MLQNKILNKQEATTIFSNVEGKSLFHNRVCFADPTHFPVICVALLPINEALLKV
jgi:hypothetical protein